MHPFGRTWVSTAFFQSHRATAIVPAANAVIVSRRRRRRCCLDARSQPASRQKRPSCPAASADACETALIAPRRPSALTAGSFASLDPCAGPFENSSRTSWGPRSKWFFTYIYIGINIYRFLIFHDSHQFHFFPSARPSGPWPARLPLWVRPWRASRAISQLPIPLIQTCSPSVFRPAIRTTRQLNSTLGGCCSFWS